jgi:hypothetical protein
LRSQTAAGNQPWLLSVQQAEFHPTKSTVDEARPITISSV